MYVVHTVMAFEALNRCVLVKNLSFSSLLQRFVVRTDVGTSLCRSLLDCSVNHAFHSEAQQQHLVGICDEGLSSTITDLLSFFSRLPLGLSLGAVRCGGIAVHGLPSQKSRVPTYFRLVRYFG